ncbi:MAG TPA: hypothetical protein VF380_06015, partial [Solirubrobacteraceae bacterium]
GGRVALGQGRRRLLVFALGHGRPAPTGDRLRRRGLALDVEVGHQFLELVADLDVEDGAAAPKAAPGRARRGATAATPTAAPSEPPTAPERDPAADLTPEDLVLKEDPKARQKPRRPRNRKHGRAR